MVVGDNIYYYKVVIDFVKQEVVQDKREHTVIGVNNTYGVMDDYLFSKARLNKKVGHNSDCIFDVARAYEMKICSVNEITGYVYSTVENDKKMYKSIKNQIDKLIDEKYGCYCNGKALTDKIIC